METPKQAYMQTREAARYLGIEPELLRKYAREKLIQSYRIGGKNLLFKIEELDLWIAKHKQEG